LIALLDAVVLSQLHFIALLPYGLRENSMQSVEIKAIENGDFDIWLALWENYQQFYKVDIPHAVTRNTWGALPRPRRTDARGARHDMRSTLRLRAHGLSEVDVDICRLLLSAGPVCFT
jgi:hypothetical protein